MFDNDGTLWCEPPVYAQVAFALERVKALADKHSGSKEKQPFKAVLDGDRKSHIGKLDKGLDEAAFRGWVLASIKDDWKTVLPPRK